MTNLFTELKIGSMTLKNRTFMAPMSLGYGNPSGIPDASQQEYWLARAKGGVGCIITDATSVDPNTPYLGNTLCFRSDESIVAYKQFTDRIHEYGCKIIPQITHPGPESISSFFGVTPISSSGYLNSMWQPTRALTLEEIPGIIQMYAKASYQAKQAGFDGIELHCAHGYMLLGSFLSPLKNKRTDEYGGSLENRARLLIEVIDAIKEKCGKEFPIILRMSGSEKIEGGNTIEDTKQLVPILIEHGIDAFEVSGGSQYDAPNKIIPSHGEPCAVNLNEALEIRKISSVPVILVGKINSSELAKSLIDENKVIVGGKYDENTLKIEPTVMDNVSWDDLIMQEEIFGPILPILTFKSADYIIEKIENRPHPLALYVFSQDKKFIDKITSHCRFGGGCINDVVVHLATPEMPFGGFGESGMGAYHGKFGFETFSHRRSILDKSLCVDLPMRYQPYKTSYFKLLKLFLK